ncbi:NUDIX hydrolase [Candidatus Kaiserbacteria bacterium]|nr:NUDIX hydrolase [Candidatus Kaiserbacteria bacterium]
MTDTFTEAESEELKRLLKKIQENDYWVPLLAWQELHRTLTLPAFELVIVDKKQKVPHILLTRYEGETIPAHKGLFHIPGGFGKVSESIQETCSRVARGELGVDVEYKGALDIHKWMVEESGIGGLSVFVACEPRGVIAESEGKRFFTCEEMLALGSKDMIQNHPHRAFAEKYLKELESKID